MFTYIFWKSHFSTAIKIGCFDCFFHVFDCFFHVFDCFFHVLTADIDVTRFQFKAVSMEFEEHNSLVTRLKSFSFVPTSSSRVVELDQLQFLASGYCVLASVVKEAFSLLRFSGLSFSFIRSLTPTYVMIVLGVKLNDF